MHCLTLGKLSLMPNRIVSDVKKGLCHPPPHRFSVCEFSGPLPLCVYANTPQRNNKQHNGQNHCLHGSSVWRMNGMCFE